MLDVKWIRENPQALDQALQNRNGQPASRKILDIDQKRRDLMTALQQAQSRRNDLSKQIGTAKQKGEDAKDLFAQVQAIGPEIKAMEAEERTLQARFEALMSTLPNVPESDVPVGPDETANVEVRRWGTPKTMANPRPHYDLGESLGLMNFEVAAKIAGSRFVWLEGDMARLERALANFMLDTQTGEHGYTEVLPPYLVNDATAYGTGQLPKFEEDLFKTTAGYWLIPTSEVPLTNFVRDEIVPGSKLPFKFTALTPCFRSEAGSAGRDTRGLIRVHQFQKVEMVRITRPENSAAALEEMVGNAEAILQKLGLPYRVIMLCTGDMGFSSRKTYDLEVWVPSQNCYREISSCSNCGDFQARRMNARFRDADERSTNFVHTLNGSGLAVGRALVAVLENYQQPDGSITIPRVLVPYMGGKTTMTAPKAG